MTIQTSIYIETSQGEVKTEAGLIHRCITVLVADDETADYLSVPDEIASIPISVKVGESRAVE